MAMLPPNVVSRGRRNQRTPRYVRTKSSFTHLLLRLLFLEPQFYVFKSLRKENKIPYYSQRELLPPLTPSCADICTVIDATCLLRGRQRCHPRCLRSARGRRLSLGSKPTQTTQDWAAAHLTFHRGLSLVSVCSCWVFPHASFPQICSHNWIQ